MLKRTSLMKDKEIWCGLNRQNITASEADVVIFGIPYDKGASYRAGAEEGPTVMRENSRISTPYTERFESFETLNIYDAGDFLPRGKRDEYYANIQSYVADLVREGKYFNMIGGDHSVTIPVIRGISDGLDEDFGIIHIDAHFDIADTLEGDDDKLGHSSTERRAIETEHVKDSDSIYFVGIRSIEPDEYRFKKENKINVASAYDCYKKGMDQVAKEVVEHMKKFNKVYVTLDIDCLDPAYAGGTGTPQFGGLTSRMVLDLLEVIYRDLNIIGMDIVEIAPKLDPALTAMFAGRKILQESWGHLARKIGKLEV